MLAMTIIRPHWVVLAALLSFNANTFSQDTNFWVFLCFGQSNMEGFPGINPSDQEGVDARFQVLAAVDFPKMDRMKGLWYPAVPPLCRPSSGLCPADLAGLQRQQSAGIVFQPEALPRPGAQRRVTQSSGRLFRLAADAGRRGMGEMSVAPMITSLDSPPTPS